jgi:predicted nucleotidyltransferase
MEQKLRQLTDRMQQAFGTELISLMLYGSSATGEHDSGFSDLNILAVVSRMDVSVLRKAEPIVRWWREEGNPSPLLLAEDEFFRSTDCFPIEMHDISERRRLLAGRDVAEQLNIDDRHYRVQVEYELRTR